MAARKSLHGRGAKLGAQEKSKVKAINAFMKLKNFMRR